MSARSSLHASLTLSPTCDISFDAVQFRAVGANLRQVASSPPQPVNSACPPARSADPQDGVLGYPRAVHLVDRALDDPPGHPKDLDLVPQFQQ
ncbi:hypothetical protein OG229_03495 [Streptomyces platensis]|uniref:hypothetical protein n=1 Tax=Streptomyces platensis TaxID=58346 RepID=UPI002E10A61B|nr:hypothetical protein OG229_03495 [Streptomyces platensis]